MTDMDALMAAADALADASQDQIFYMDMCGDTGDLERNLRNALTAYRAAREAVTRGTPPAFATSA